MSAVRMDGKALSAKVRGSILAETEALKKQGVTPGLAVIIVGNDPASEIYVRNKERACEQCGFYSEKYALPEETTQEELLDLIADSDGKDPVVLYAAAEKSVKRLPAGRNVNADQDLVVRLEQSFGKGNVKVVEKRIENISRMK